MRNAPLLPPQRTLNADSPGDVVTLVFRRPRRRKTKKLPHWRPSRLPVECLSFCRELGECCATSCSTTAPPAPHQ